MEEEVSRIFIAPSIAETTPAVWDPLPDEGVEDAPAAMVCITPWPPATRRGSAQLSCAARLPGAWRPA
ncbi:hypothetical protein FK256_04690 [Actinomyces johnsonii]|uniref:Uncharacterized protein n=1 Tax=Actinomyces johnsonii TaxID=544581 RepID=A0A508ABC9_9ACTO|nr:hypothetical protein F4W10_08625 [Actinomyces johnsonii]TQD44325.1 hypothetical protein FK256_04690 [Actinomyces johnsonii]